jgi:tetratricopeptide (TPR) repeat protein
MENYTEYIDDYFAGNLNPEERKNFETQMQQDKNFAEQVAFYLAAKQALREELANEKKEWFRELASRNVDLSVRTRSAQVRKMWVYRLAAAAVFVGVVFFGGSLLFQGSTSSTALADKYISNKLEDLGVKMAVTPDSMQQGKNFYNVGKYDSALQMFQAIIQGDSSKYEAKQFAGIVCLRVGDYNKALQYFQQLEKYSLEVNPAVFYQAITFMKRNQPGDKETARQLLERVAKEHLAGDDVAPEWLHKRW